MCIIAPNSPIQSSSIILESSNNASTLYLNPKKLTTSDAKKGLISAVCSTQKTGKTGKTDSNVGLGSITKLESTYPLCSKTLEDTAFKLYSDCAKHQKNRRSSYELKRTSERLLPEFRINNCLNKRVTAVDEKGKEKGVDIRLNKTNGKATFGNLMRCDSVWVCPCCSGRILSHRGKEVEKGVQTWQEVGGSVWMLTLTHSHTKGENLDNKLGLLSKALKRFFGDRSMKAVFEQAGKVGQIKALEFTHGAYNGWHPHHHILMFSKIPPDDFKNITVSVLFDKDNDNEIQYISYKREQQLMRWNHWHVIDEIQQVDLETFIKYYWRRICKSVGLGAPSVEHGVTLSDASKVKTYLTKFKTAQELTNAQAKRAKNGNRNQWEILADAHKKSKLNDEEMMTDEYKKALESERLWREYALATKGEQQLRWSDGLKKMLLIEELDDDEILEGGENKDDEVISIYELQIELWHFIKRKGWKAQVLEIVEDDYKNETFKLIDFIENAKRLQQEEFEEYCKREQKRIDDMLPPWWYESSYDSSSNYS